MILLLGATGYIGQGFARALRWRKESFIPLSRNALDYTKFELLFDYVRRIQPALVINAAECSEGIGENPTEIDRLEMLQANSLLPQTVSRVCAMTNTPWGHVSSGSIYTGGKILQEDTLRIDKDFTQLRIRELFDLHPERFFGFTEADQPNFSFQNPPCSFYSGTKCLAEEAIRAQGQSYIWRLRLTFNEEDHPSNFLSDLQVAARICDAIDSLSHLDDCVSACLELWERRAPFGIYNVVNPGGIRTGEIIRKMRQILGATVRPPCVEDDSLVKAAKIPISHCILDGSKLFKAGIRLRSVRNALEDSLQKWRSQPVINTSLSQSLPAGYWC
jgi:dTDP-4-dehydrorhamnose reductase